MTLPTKAKKRCWLCGGYGILAEIDGLFGSCSPSVDDCRPCPACELVREREAREEAEAMLITTFNERQGALDRAERAEAALRRHLHKHHPMGVGGRAAIACHEALAVLAGVRK